MHQAGGSSRALVFWTFPIPGLVAWIAGGGWGMGDGQVPASQVMACSSASAPGVLGDKRVWQACSRLTSLVISQVEGKDMQHLARWLPQLVDLEVRPLHWVDRIDVTAPDLFVLTALTGLTNLRADKLPTSGPSWPPVTTDLSLTLTPKGPCVWEQLLMFGLDTSICRVVLQQEVTRLLSDLPQPQYAATISPGSQLLVKLQELQQKALNEEAAGLSLG